MINVLKYNLCSSFNLFFEERRNFTGEIIVEILILRKVSARVFRPRVYPRSLSSDMLIIYCT